MAAISKVRAFDGAVVRAEQAVRAPSQRASSLRAHRAAPADRGAPRINAPAAVLAHGSRDRFRIRLEGRQAGLYLQLVAAEIASCADLFRIRVAPASSSLVLWVRLGSALEGDGARAVALVSEALRRIALGERRCDAPIETADADHLGLGLSFLKAVAL